MMVNRLDLAGTSTCGTFQTPSGDRGQSYRNKRDRPGRRTLGNRQRRAGAECEQPRQGDGRAGGHGDPSEAVGGARERSLHGECERRSHDEIGEVVLSETERRQSGEGEVDCGDRSHPPIAAAHIPEEQKRPAYVERRHAVASGGLQPGRLDRQAGQVGDLKRELFAE